MIVCRKCSRRHPDGTDFCVCGAFLEFDGEHVPDDGPSAPLARPTASSPAPAAPTSPLSPVSPAPPPPSRPPPSRPAPSRPSAEPAPWSGFDPVSPPSEPTGSWGSVQAQLPDAPLATPGAEPVDVRPTMRVGDIACIRCGTPNPPTRQFCQHCGHELGAARAGAAAAGGGDARGPSWWAKLRAKLRRKGISTDPNRLAAEAHLLSRGGLSGRSMLFRGGGIALLLGGLLAFLGPWRGTVTAWARDRLGASRYEVVDLELEQVETVAVDAEPVVYPMQGPERTIDRHLNTSWATHWVDPVGRGLDAPPDDDACQTAERTDTFLRYTFPEPTDLARIRIIPGRYDGDEARATFFRPRVLELRWDDQCRYLAVADTGELEEHGFDHDDVERIDVRVVGVYADPTSEPTVDISEIVFERDR